MKSKALAVQSILEMTEDLANGCQVSGHSLLACTDRASGSKSVWG